MKRLLLLIALFAAATSAARPSKRPEPPPVCYLIRFDGEVWAVCEDGRIFRIL